MSGPAQGWRQRERSAWLAIVTQHARRYPGWDVDDLYKLAMQAALGAEHAAPDAQTARHRLLREIGRLGPGPDELEVDPISPDGRLARVHLRPFLAAGGDPGELLEAFLATAATHRAAPGRLRRLWSYLLTAAPDQRAFERAALSECLARYAAAGYPAVHHSPAYSARFRPAYRVVDVRRLADSSRKRGAGAVR
jgi:hypothetical protein